MARVLNIEGEVVFSGTNAQAKQFFVNKGLNGFKVEYDDVPERATSGPAADLGPIEERLAGLEERAVAAEQANVQLVEALTASQDRLNEIGGQLEALLSEPKADPIDLAPIEARITKLEKTKK